MRISFKAFLRFIAGCILVEGIVLIIVAGIQDSIFSLAVMAPVAIVIIIVGAYLNFAFWLSKPDKDAKVDQSVRNTFRAIGGLLVVGSLLLLFGRSDVNSVILNVISVIDAIICGVIGLNLFFLAS